MAIPLGPCRTLTVGSSLGQKEGQRGTQRGALEMPRLENCKHRLGEKGACNKAAYIYSHQGLHRLYKLTPGGHDQRRHKPQDPAELHAPEQQHTHQHHRHSCSHCPGGWPCLQRALHGGRGTSSPHSCSLCAYTPALEGP